MGDVWTTSSGNRQSHGSWLLGNGIIGNNYLYIRWARGSGGGCMDHKFRKPSRAMGAGGWVVYSRE